ncbi:hypothetical protein [Falsiroseomonas sp. CW058]|uniref:hypothetical protein n=1 Tax=Falsiroseomonas sp. CW058 TaxID=3388664 RepID=UPI003D321858
MATRGLPLWPWTTCETDALPAAERLLVDAARLWAAEARRGVPPEPALRRLLAAESAGAAAAPLDALMRAVAAPGLRLGCPLCPNIAGDEAALLLVAALAQRGPRREALACLVARLPGAGAYAAMGAAIAMGCAFRAAGLRFADPWQEGG